MLVNGDYSKQEIADRIGVHRTTLYNWVINNNEGNEKDTKVDGILAAINSSVNKEIA